MYLTFLSSSKKYKLLTKAISTLRALKTSLSPKEPNPSDKESSFNNIIKSLKSLQKEALPSRQNEIRKLVKNSHQKFRLSTFSLMEHDFRENTHSNILQYIFDYNLIGPKGAEILSAFIKKVSDGFEEISNLIKLREYIIEREFSVKGGRVDLFIKDDTNKFVIVIENKLLSPVSVKGKESVGESEIDITQLSNYRPSISQKYEPYKKAFILLLFSEIDDLEKYSPFIFVEYSVLASALNSFNYVNDNILKEYQILLYSLGRFSSDQLLELKRTFSSYLHNQKILNQTLNSIELLRIFIYGNN